jgi:hypothetical protein
MGFLSDVETDFLKGDGNLTWKECTAKIIGSKSNAYDDLVWGISSKTQFKGMFLDISSVSFVANSNYKQTTRKRLVSLKASAGSASSETKSSRRKATH